MICSKVITLLEQVASREGPRRTCLPARLGPGNSASWVEGPVASVSPCLTSGPGLSCSLQGRYLPPFYAQTRTASLTAWLSSSSQLCCSRWRAEVPDYQLSPGLRCCLLEKRSRRFMNSLSTWSQREILSGSPQSQPSFCFLVYLHLVTCWSLS